MKLEDIKLKYKDIVYFDDGNIRIVRKFEDDCSVSDIYLICRKIVKIERYVKYKQNSETPKNCYLAQVIYERSEILTKEEREYLRAVIRPVREDIRYIEK